MASNATTLADENGDFSDWIEIQNPDAGPINLAGWYLTDDATNKVKWPFPAITLPAGGYLVVFASGKDRREPARQLHTNFSLDADGEYLALIAPDGVTASTAFAPSFPRQKTGVSYGFARNGNVVASVAGVLRRPTPGAVNSDGVVVSLTATVAFSRAAGAFSQPITLQLSGAGTGQRIRYTVSSSSDPASEVTTASRLYTTPITIEVTTTVSAAVFAADDATRGPVTTSHYYRVNSAGAERADNFTSALPVVVVDNNGGGELTDDRTYHPAWLHVFSPNSAGTTSLTAAPGLSTPVEIRVRGNSSAEFPKKSYNVGLRDDKGDSKSQALLGLDKSADWALVSPWKYDRSSIRSAYLYALSNSIGRWAPRTRFAELFFNWDGNDLDSGDYLGITVLTDRLTVDSDRIDIKKLDAKDNSATEVTGGYVLKIDDKLPTEYGFITDHGIPDYDSCYVVVDTPSADKFSDKQRDYIRGYVQLMENAIVAGYNTGWRDRSYHDYLDFASWVDHHLLEVFSANIDGLGHSDYFHKDRGGKLVSGPVWDFDRALGSYDPRTKAPEMWSPGPVDYWEYGWYGYLARDPEFQQAWIDRWQKLRAKEFSTAALTALAQSIADQVTPAAAARDAARWPDNASPTGGGFTGEITRLKDWLTRRAVWIDQQFVAAPTVAASASTLVFTAPAGAQLAYTLDGSDPRSLGGAIAPGTKFASGPLTVATTANVHARSYRADMANGFPGSPWSSAVGGASSSPITPVARIVNLSSRAIVGADEDALIAGLVVADTAAKTYLIRAVGPTLAAFGATDVVADPLLRLARADGTELARNSNWQSGPDASVLPATARAVGAFPLAADATDAALLPRVAAGNYTMRVTSAGGRTGSALAEVYESTTNGRTLNLSTRARVRASADGALIGGFVIQGPAYKRVLVRAVGPTLGTFGLTTALSDPVLTVFSGQTAVATNDNWAASPDSAAIAAATTAVGAFALPAASADSALLLTLAPGAYTVEVKGQGTAEGVALLEIYDVP
ncbi:MAG: CotH kinase family protein [Verrucomicrobia bacterium]|nr:CotH kinase family protein [Verrucomicrobiota bacterium]